MPALGYTFLVVKAQQTHCDAASRGQRLQFTIINREMFTPCIATWVIEGYNFTSRRIKGTKIAALVAIAISAAQAEIFCTGLSTVFLRIDVIDLM